MSTRDVAAAFGVGPQTITRWAKAGKLTPITTLGGHRRYRPAQVRALLTTGAAGAADSEAPPQQTTNNNKKKNNNSALPDHDVITRARLNALAAALTAYGLRVRIGADAVAVRNPTPHGKDTSPNPGHYQAITTAPNQDGVLTWHWAWTTPEHPTRLCTRPIAPADDITSAAASIAHALGTRTHRRPRTTPSAGAHQA